MRTAPILVLVILAAVAPALGQLAYPGSPDWVSSDTPYSTGGALVDIDRDGWLDLVVANGNDMRRERLVVYYNDGTGNLPTAPNWQSSDQRYNGHLSVADVNGDGWLDVAVGLTVNDGAVAAAYLYINNTGTLSLTPAWQSDVQLAAFHVAFGDVNGDGRPDLALGTGFPYSGAHQWHNYIYMNTGTMLESTPSWISADTWDFGDVFFCDVNRDGWLDLIGVGEGTDTWVYYNDAGQLDTTATWRTTDNSGQFSVMGTYGDVDADGWLDLFVTDNTQLLSGSGYFRRYDGQPGGWFTTTPTWSYFDGYGSAVALADVDADGDLDLATGAWWDRTRYFANVGGLYGATPTWNSSGTSVVEAIIFGDVDQDGLRYPVEVFPPAAGGSHLYALAHQPIDDLLAVEVDGVALWPDEYTADLGHGWVSVGPLPEQSVTIRYLYSLKPDMAVTNWDDSLGNYLYYNQNAAPRFGDTDGDGDADVDDLLTFLLCLTGPDIPAAPACAAADGDLDGDADLADYALLATVLTAALP